MQVKFEKVDSPEKEEAFIKAQSNTEDIKAAIEILEGGKRKLPLIKDGETILCETTAFYYIESVDKRSFVYTKDDCFETKLRLYELEETLSTVVCCTSWENDSLSILAEKQKGTFITL